MQELILVMVDTKIALCHLIASDTLLHSEVHGKSLQYQKGMGKKKRLHTRDTRSTLPKIEPTMSTFAIAV